MKVRHPVRKIQKARPSEAITSVPKVLLGGVLVKPPQEQPVPAWVRRVWGGSRLD